MTKNSWSRDRSEDEDSDVSSWAEFAADVAGLGYWSLDVETGEFSCSESLYRLLGQNIESAPDMKAAMSALILANDSQQRDDFVRAAVESAAGHSARFRQTRVDGSWRVFANHTICKRGPDGAPKTVRGVVIDVSDREIHRVLTEHGNDVIVQVDMEGRLTYLSPNVTAMTGFTPAELLGVTVGELVPPEQDDALEAAVTGAMDHPDRRAPCVEITLLHKDGRQLWLESHPAPLRDPATGQRIGATDIVRDITERKAAEARLEFTHTLLATQMEASPNGILVVDADWKIVSFNRRFTELWGLAREDLAHGDGARVREQLISLTKAPDAATDDDGDLELLDSRIIEHHTVPLVAPTGATLGRAWFFSDVTQQRQSLAQALTAASQDGLTGLANRAAFVERLRREIAHGKRTGAAFAVMCLDLDHFKHVNDTLGHPVGDALLEAVAARLRANTREADTVARFGGDEFAIIMSAPREATDVATLARKLIAVIAEPFPLDGGRVYTGASIGIDVSGPEIADAETLLSHADLALYQAKGRGRGCYTFFTPSMDAEVRGRVAMAAELREAISNDQLFLLYQPQVCMKTGKVTGVEALLRWRHPRLGVLRPEAFISVGEQTGLMEGVGRWALWTAIRQAGNWLAANLPSARLSANLCALQFRGPLTLEADISAALAEAGLAPDRLEIELTEAALITATRENGQVIPNLRRSGVSVAIDDFGLGYSSLHHLSQFPVDRIKIAQIFVRNLDTSAIDASIVKAAIGIAHGLGVAVLATGVETPEQFDLLKRLGCAEAQGSLVGPPKEFDQLSSILVGTR
jgi:diguanylate cyclase (GGDEF)-like protein/PAS domain S-box-containing protein